MFQMFKKNNNNRNSYIPNYPTTYPSPMYNANMGYDDNMMDMEVNELKRKINDLYMRINRLESFLGVRNDDSNYS